MSDTNTWGFNSHIFIRATVPVFSTSEVELEPTVPASSIVFDQYIPVLSFEVNEGWEVVEEKLEDGVLTTVWFYTSPIPAGSTYTPLFDSWSMTNFRVHNGICGQHTYKEITDKINEAGLERYSLQSDGKSGSPEDLWKMVFVTQIASSFDFKLVRVYFLKQRCKIHTDSF